MTPEQKFAVLNLALPPAPTPMGVYKPCLVVGNFIYVSGHGPLNLDGTRVIGCIGQDMDIEAGKAAAQQVGLAILATLKANLGSLDNIKRVIKVLGMVNCTADFERHPYVINGCSELFAEVWGTERALAYAVRLVWGSLPENIPVEIEAVFELQ